jgi:glutamyl-tRNA reductase
MILLAVGCNHRSAPVDVRERIAFQGDQLEKALDLLARKLGWEAVILSTCNRVELYLGHPLDVPPANGTWEDPAELFLDFLARFHGHSPSELRPHLYIHRQGEAARHLFRVASGLDSMVLGEGQIAGQVKQAYELAQQHSSVGPLLHSLFRHARQATRQVRSETGIARGQVSVSSAAVEYVRQVLDHFHDKTILVIGAGKMGELTLKHLRRLEPGKILVTNRNREKAEGVARGCQGEVVPWEKLADCLVEADIVLSTTGSPEPIMTKERWQSQVLARKHGGTSVILDIAVPRDFDQAIHDGDRTCLFNIDDLHRIRDATLADRQKHLPSAEELIQRETQTFLKDWARRRNGPLIASLTRDLEAKKTEIVRHLFTRLNGKLTENDCKYIEHAFNRLQNQFLHGPITALTEESHTGNTGSGHTLLNAMRKLFRLEE